MSVSNLIIRLVIAFISLLILTRMMGRKELSQMTFFNFVSAISIGTLGASLAIDSSLSIRNGILALILWSAFTIALGYLDIKSKKFREGIEGQPLILIKRGMIMESELRKARLDVDALNSLLRQKDVFSISDVDYAIFEIDGKLSVLKKESNMALTKSDMAIELSQQNLYHVSTEVINDGEIITANLKKLNLSSEWLLKQLRLLGVTSISDIFYAEVLKDGTLYIDHKNDVLN